MVVVFHLLAFILTRHTPTKGSGPDLAPALRSMEEASREAILARRRLASLVRAEASHATRPSISRGSPAATKPSVSRGSPAASACEKPADATLKEAEVLLDELEASTERSVRIAGLRPGRENALLDELRDLRDARESWRAAVDELSQARATAAQHAAEAELAELRRAHDAMTRERDEARSAEQRAAEELETASIAQRECLARVEEQLSSRVERETARARARMEEQANQRDEDADARARAWCARFEERCTQEVARAEHDAQAAQTDAASARATIKELRDALAIGEAERTELGTLRARLKAETAARMDAEARCAQAEAAYMQSTSRHQEELQDQHSRWTMEQEAWREQSREELSAVDRKVRKVLDQRATQIAALEQKLSKVQKDRDEASRLLAELDLGFEMPAALGQPPNTRAPT